MGQTLNVGAVDTNLGFYAKSSNRFASKPKGQAVIENKKIKYQLQRTAQTLLYDANNSKQHRTCGCHRYIASDGVSVYRTKDGENAMFGNLISCGSVWSCPICAAKITEKRKEDMQKAQSAWLSQGGSCLMMTLTFPHKADMPLSELLEKFSKSLDYFKNSKTYKKVFGTATASIKKLTERAIKDNRELKLVHGEYQRLGVIRNLEVTHGVNGWHPHVHECIFVEDERLYAGTDSYFKAKEKGTLKVDFDSEVINEAHGARELLTKTWVNALLKFGLGTNEDLQYMLERALDIRGGDYVAEYFAKYGKEPLEVNGWTIAHEMTKSNAKMGRKTRQIGGEWHFTPFQLLAHATNGDEEAGQLFKEFSRNFEGKRMNYWTNGLKDWFAINEKEDAEIAEELENSENEKELVLYLNSSEWKSILSTNTRWECLKAATKGRESLIEFLNTLGSRSRTHSGFYLSKTRPPLFN